MTLHTVEIPMGGEDLPHIREFVTITPMSEIAKDPAKSMATIVASDALSRVLKYMAVLATATTLMAILSAVQTYQEIQHDMDQRDQQIERLEGETHHTEGTSTFETNSTEGDSR